MDSLLIILVVVLIAISLVILYFQLKAKPKKEENPTQKIQEEMKQNQLPTKKQFISELTSHISLQN